MAPLFNLTLPLVALESPAQAAPQSAALHGVIIFPLLGIALYLIVFNGFPFLASALRKARRGFLGSPRVYNKLISTPQRND